MNHQDQRNIRGFLTPGGKIFFDTHISPLLLLQGFANEIALDLVFDGRRVPALVNFKQEWEDQESSPQWLISMFQATDRRKYEQSLLAARRELEAANFALERRAEEMRLMADELTKARDAVVRASANRAAYFACLSHELRTPLNAIIGYSSMIANEFADRAPREELREFGDQIENAGLHLLTLINDILDFSQINANATILRCETIMVDGAVARAVRLLRKRFEEKRQTLLIEGSPTDVHVWADPVRLHQVLLNVISNAMKYTPELGSVTVDFTSDGAGHAVIQVSDTGIGIPTEEIDKVFEPFTRAANAPRQSTEGTGLGLPITRRLVELMGGVISLSSKVGVGTSVEIRLPTQAPEEPATQPPPPG